MSKPLRMRRLRSKNRKKEARKAACHLPNNLACAAFSYADNNQSRTVKGTFGAAGMGRSLSAEEIDQLRSKYETGPE